MDGVIADFTSSAITALNKEYNRSITLEEYADFGGWNMWEPYNCTEDDFWRVINSHENLYAEIKAYPWVKELYSKLYELGEITIVTAPSFHGFNCASQKLYWLKEHLGIDAGQVFIGYRKRLLAGNGILIDDNANNVNDFIANGGQAILVPATWNTNGLTFEMVWDVIQKGLDKWQQSIQ